jgi:hypothetical protein
MAKASPVATVKSLMSGVKNTFHVFQNSAFDVIDPPG